MPNFTVLDLLREAPEYSFQDSFQIHTKLQVRLKRQISVVDVIVMIGQCQDQGFLDEDRLADNTRCVKLNPQGMLERSRLAKIAFQKRRTNTAKLSNWQTVILILLILIACTAGFQLYHFDEVLYGWIAGALFIGVIATAGLRAWAVFPVAGFLLLVGLYGDSFGYEPSGAQSAEMVNASFGLAIGSMLALVAAPIRDFVRRLWK